MAILSETEPIIIKTFGTFSIRQGDAVIAESDNRSKKLWKLLEYLVHHRSRTVTKEELLTALWQGEGDPDENAAALKTLLHRARNTLDQLQFEGSRYLILRQDGGYLWNPRFPLRIDTDDFVMLAESAKHTDLPEEKLNAALRAMAFYRGRYLNGKYANEEWAKNAADLYEKQYLYCYNAAVQILAGDECYDQIVFLSRHAMEIDPAQESFYYNEIAALLEKGDEKGALAAYDRAMELFYQVLRKTPSASLRGLYRRLRRADNGIEPDIAGVMDKLAADRSDRAVRCEYDTFRLLYQQYSARASLFPEKQLRLVLLTVVTPQRNGEIPPPAVLDRALTLLENCLQEQLSEGDVYTRYSLTQLLVLATFADEDELISCMSKIRRSVPADQAAVSIRSEKL